MAYGRVLRRMRFLMSEVPLYHNNIYLTFCDTPLQGLGHWRDLPVVARNAQGAKELYILVLVRRTEVPCS